MIQLRKVRDEKNIFCFLYLFIKILKLNKVIKNKNNKKIYIKSINVLKVNIDIRIYI